MKKDDAIGLRGNAYSLVRRLVQHEEYKPKGCWKIFEIYDTKQIKVLIRKQLSQSILRTTGMSHHWQRTPDIVSNPKQVE